MSLFDSISRTLKGLLNDAADSVQDPSRDSRQIVRELDESIAKAENSLIEIQAQVATQQSKRDVAADKAKKYEDGAKRALQSGDEALAREALGAQATAEAERDALAKELVTLEPSVAQLKSQIDDMRGRRNDLNARSNILQAKQQIAQAGLLRAVREPVLCGPAQVGIDQDNALTRRRNQADEPVQRGGLAFARSRGKHHERVRLPGLEGEIDGSSSDVEHREQAVGSKGGVLLCGPGIWRGCEVNSHDLMTIGAGDERL